MSLGISNNASRIVNTAAAAPATDVQTPVEATPSSRLAEAPPAGQGFMSDAFSLVDRSTNLFRSGAGVNALTAQAGASAASTRVDITDSAQRQKLIEGAPQTNLVAGKADNAGSICAGASLLNAMLLDCKSPADARRNGEALEAAADKHAAWGMMPPSVDRGKVKQALQNLKDGKLSPTDAQHLQQLTYALGKMAQRQGETHGISAGGMGAAVTILRAEGAFQNSSPTFHLASQPKGPDHWTVSSEGTHANSMPANGESGSAQVAQGTPANVQMNAGNAAWQGQVQVVGGEVVSTWRQPEVPGGMPPTGPNEAYTVKLDSSNYKADDLSAAGYVQNKLIVRYSHPEKVRLGSAV